MSELDRQFEIAVRDAEIDSRITEIKELREYINILLDNIEAKDKEIDRLKERLDQTYHVVMEISGQWPGGTVLCTCEACAAVARRMDDAGWCDDVRDRWWDRQPMDVEEE